MPFLSTELPERRFGTWGIHARTCEELITTRWYKNGHQTLSTSQTWGFPSEPFLPSDHATLVSTVEELDALRNRLSLSQSGSIVGVEMEGAVVPQSLVTQPRKKGRPKLSVRGVRDFPSTESPPSVSVEGSDASDVPSGDPRSTPLLPQ